MSRELHFLAGSVWPGRGICRACRKIKNRGYEVASYSGFTMEELLRGSREQRMLLEKLDVLIDGPYIEEQRSLSLAYRGSRNQRIIDVPESLRTGEITEIVSGRWQGEY